MFKPYNLLMFHRVAIQDRFRPNSSTDNNNIQKICTALPQMGRMEPKTLFGYSNYIDKKLGKIRRCTFSIYKDFNGHSDPKPLNEFNYVEMLKDHTKNVGNDFYSLGW